MKRTTIFITLVILIFQVYSTYGADRIPGAEFAVAIESGDLDAVKALVNGGAKADTWIDYGEHKITPLMKACWDGEQEIASFLIDNGADVNATDNDGETPIYSAIKRDRPELTQLLIEKGAKVNIKDSRQFSPLTIAAAAGSDKIIELLVNAGADLKTETYGLTSLMFAISAKKLDTVRLLVKLGAPVNQVSSMSGQTALFSAIYSANSEMVQALIDLKANVNFKTKDGETPIKAAQKGDQDDLIAILKAAGAKQ
jgi:ankyrin repeat protein